MILISGTQLNTQDLPFSDIMEYVIEPNPSVLDIKLKTIAKAPVCLGVYLHQSLGETHPLAEEVTIKTTYFTDDNHLITLLENGGKEKPEEPTPLEEPQEEEVKVFNQPNPEPQYQPEPTPQQGILIIEDVDTTSFQEELLTIPNITDDENLLNQQLQNKQRIIDQKDGVILDLQKTMDDMYKLQEIQLLEMRDLYEKRVDEANETIANLQKQVEESGVPEELQWFLKYATYSDSYKASLKEGFTHEDIQKLGKIKSDIYIFASGAGDSIHNMMKNVKALADRASNALIVDFSNDYYLTARYKIQTRDSSMMLKDPQVQVHTITKQVDNIELIPTTFYNDIGLLGVDWLSVLTRLLQHANGRPIIFLFNNINSFSVRYTVSKLATVGKLYVFAKSNPVILSTLFGDLAFIPPERFKLVATEYIDAVQPVLEQMSKKYHVTAFKDMVNWGKLGIKI